MKRCNEQATSDLIRCQLELGHVGQHNDAGMHWETMPRDVDSVLLATLDAYLARLRESLLARLRIGEQQYKGKWRTMTLEQLLAARDEKWLDWIAYTIMAETWPTRNVGSD